MRKTSIIARSINVCKPGGLILKYWITREVIIIEINQAKVTNAVKVIGNGAIFKYTKCKYFRER